MNVKQKVFVMFQNSKQAGQFSGTGFDYIGLTYCIGIKFKGAYILKK